MMKRLTMIAVAVLAWGLLLAVTPPRAGADETNAPGEVVTAPSGPTNPVSAAKAKPKGKAHFAIQIDGSDDEGDALSNQLTADQVFQLEKIRATKGEIPGHAPLIVAIVFGCPVAIVAILLFYRYRKNVLLHRTLAAMIEKGTPIPPGLLADEKEKKAPRSDLRRGVMLTAIGAGLAIFFLAQKEDAWGLGMIPLLIGAGYLIMWRLEQKKQNGQN